MHTTTPRRLALLVAAGLAIAACSDAEITISSDETTASPSTIVAPDTSAAPDTTAAPTTDAASAPTTNSTSAIDWKPCTDLEFSAPVECATVQVPLDYDQPDGEQIDIAINRLAAADPAVREGAILFNPGGPGASAREMIEGLGAVLGSAAPELAERFDLIGFDPRGVGASNPVRCVDDAWKDRYALADTTPDDAAEQTDSVESLRFPTLCREALGDTLFDYSTNNTARDIDRIREALGDEQISFYGISYGTLLGATYGGLFPDRARVLVLDSAFIPDLQAEPSVAPQLRGFQQSFDAWTAACAADTSCPFTASSPAEVTARWQALGDQLDSTPLVVNGRQVNRETLALATVSALYDKSFWQPLAQGLADAEQGDGTVLLAAADGYNGRGPDGRYSNQNDAQTVINCASGIGDSVDLTPAELAAISPVFGPILPVQTSDCVDPTLTEPRASIAFAGSAPVVVIGGTSDAATPFAMAEEMVKRIGSGATLVVFEGEGHGQSLSDPCLLEVVTKALLTATAPGAGTVCTQQG